MNTLTAPWEKFVASATLLTCLVFTGGISDKAESAEVVDRIVAIVNEEIILQSELNRHLEIFEEQLRRSRGLSAAERNEMMSGAPLQVLNELIEEKLADQVIQETGIRVSESEINAAIERVKTINRLTQEEFIRALQAQGLTFEDYRENFRQQLLRNKLINQEVKSKIVITEDDIRDYRKANPDKFNLDGKYQLRNILMLYGRDNPGARGEMEAVLQELEEGACFSETARKYSMAPNAMEGGELGVFALEDLSAHLQPIVADLSPGEYTGVVETDLGFQIFFVEDIKEPENQDIEKINHRIEQMLYEEKVEGKFEEWIASLRKLAHIRIML